jgi:hypothetical protein
MYALVQLENLQCDFGIAVFQTALSIADIGI